MSVVRISTGSASSPTLVYPAASAGAKATLSPSKSATTPRWRVVSSGWITGSVKGVPSLVLTTDSSSSSSW